MINKTAEVWNSLLINQYAQMDSRFHMLMHVLKRWNRALSEDPHGRLNNYTLSLLLIAYMQYKKHLPNLQARAATHKINLMKNHVVLKSVTGSKLASKVLVDVINVGFEDFADLLEKFAMAGLLREPAKDAPYFCPLDHSQLNLEPLLTARPSKFHCVP